MADIRAGVRLSLQDQYSQGIKGAGAATKDFGGTALAAVDRVNKAFSGLAGTLGTLGVAFGAGAAVKTYIDLDDRMVRIGTDLGLAADKTNELKCSLYEAAQDPSIKMGTDSLLEAMETLAGKNFDAGVIQDSLRDIGLVMKATGATGEEAAAFFIESFKRGMNTEEIMKSLDDMSVIGDELRNQFSLSDFTKAFSGLEATSTLLGKSAMNTTELYTAMNILGAGTKSSARAVSAYTAIVNELADPRKQEILFNMGIEVREGGIGDFRNLADILQEIAATDEGTGNFDKLSREFSTAAMEAIFAYSQFGHLADGLENLGDTTGEIAKKAENNARSLSSNLQNLQTAFYSFADERLTKPLEKLTQFLNFLAERPKIATAAMWGLTAAVAAAGAVKFGAGLTTLIANLKGFKGGKIDLAGAAGGGAGIPVHVTNWDGTPGTGIPRPGLLDQYGNPLAGTPKPPAPVLPGSAPAQGGISPGGAVALGAAVVAASYATAQAAHSKLAPLDPAVPGMSNYYSMHWGARRKAWAQYEAEHPEEMTYALRVAAARAAQNETPAGAGIISRDELPADIEEGGREAVVKNEIPASIREEISSLPRIPQGGGNPVLEGNARLENHVYLHADRYEVESFVRDNTIPLRFETGRAREVRDAAL
jgi:hypothetical protein